MFGPGFCHAERHCMEPEQHAGNKISNRKILNKAYTPKIVFQAHSPKLDFISLSTKPYHQASKCIVTYAHIYPRPRQFPASQEFTIKTGLYAIVLPEIRIGFLNQAACGHLGERRSLCALLHGQSYHLSRLGHLLLHHSIERPK